MSRLSDIAAKPTLQQYAQGAAQSALQPVADFLAPTVDVPVAVGYYKKYTEKNRFRIPRTRRPTGGRAVELGWDAEDATYNCAAHALDFPVDMNEDDASMEYALQEGAGMIAEVAGLAHEKTVIDAAIASVGAGTDKNWGSGGTNPIDDLDTAIIAVLKACKYGSLMSVGCLFGALAWQQFKNNSNVTGKFIVGNPKTATKVAVPTLDAVGELFLGVPDVRASFAVYDTAAEGVAEAISFMLERAVLVFARKSSPTRRDPSFMKTFRLAGRWMVPGTYQRDDGRVEVAKFDWSEDVQVTNSAAAVRLNGNAS
jgi:hypothetical protein